MKLRAYRDSDLETVAALFTASIHALAVDAYSAEQRAAWAPEIPDLREWQERLTRQKTLIAETDAAIVGFLSYSDDGHIDLLYTLPAFARRGVASALYRETETALSRSGAKRLLTEASLVAAPFFAQQGFRIVEEQHVERRGIAFRRYLMDKALAS